MANQKLKVSERKIKGRKVKQLRKEGLLPANIYGKKTKSTALQLDLDDFEKAFQETGETGLVDLEIENGKTKKKKTVLITNVQTDPVTDNPIHVDFHEVDLKEKVTASVPVEVLGEAPAEKQGLGTVVVHMVELEVEALPMDLPEKFEVDITSLSEVDQSILIKDLDYDKKKVEISGGSEEVVVKVEPLREEEEEPAPVDEELVEGEVEVDGEEKESEDDGEEAGEKEAKSAEVENKDKEE
jgi:large subunit ribosomal protein L25